MAHGYQQSYMTLMVVAVIFTGLLGCNRLKKVDLPPEVFSLQNEVVAYKADWEPDKKVTQELSLAPLYKATGNVDDLTLLEYAQGTPVKEMAYRQDDNRITAEFVGGRTYLLVAQPKGRLKDIHTVLCLADRHRIAIDRIQPDLFLDKLCPVILCEPSLVRTIDLSTRFPELGPISNIVDFGDVEIGGWGPGGGTPGGICERCTGLKKPGRVFPVDSCRDKISVPGRDTECQQILFQDNFDADSVGNPPALSPSGDPSDDAVVLQGGSNAILVVDSLLHGSNAVKIDRGSGPTTRFTAVVGSNPEDNGKYRVSFKAYSTHASQNTPPMTVSVNSSSDQAALRIIVINNQYQLVSGMGSEVLPVSYAVNRVDDIVIRLDVNGDTFSVEINGSQVADRKPYLDTGFADASQLQFEYPSAILEAFPATYVVDDIKICNIEP